MLVIQHKSLSKALKLAKREGITSPPSLVRKRKQGNYQLFWTN